ncbi:hypothetical protein PLESTB_001625500 [Pleodorina starrii]|uniref:Uncharacterized protein n=1 Tax=Pleodorina starrii TaxID=330485 RepID=A0A9W6BZ65_9CHLO|nr:hypothetical protein PLESTM_001809300 [Pleodorina starrii]GLC60547.1 hypothetical protein PLESTB_001625500 [Pleodorina starrii]GLC76645.1 hypothetical protein PLESTF_001809200 [Pleodorina starrii]
MGNEVSLALEDIHAGPVAVRARLRSGGASANKRMLFPEDVGPLPKGCKCTPLGFAILSWNIELLDTLLASGADPRKPVGLPLRFDFTPLQLAVALGFAAGVRHLLAAGADANAPLQLKRGTTTASRPSTQPSHQPPHSRHLHQPPPHPPQGAPPAEPNAGSEQLLLPDCLARARPGDAPLHIAIDCAAAAEFGAGSSPASVGGCRMEVFEALLGHPATDLNRPNARGRTPLYKACKRRVDVFVTLLATHPGVDVNHGMPLFAAIKADSPALVRALLQAGAGRTLAVANAAGQTPLSYAVHRAAGADGEVGNDGGGGGRAEIVALLVQAGSHVDPELVSYAMERGLWGVVAALRSGDPGSATSPPATAAAASASPAAATVGASPATAGASPAAAATSDDRDGGAGGGSRRDLGAWSSGGTPRRLAAAAAWALTRLRSGSGSGSGSGAAGGVIGGTPSDNRSGSNADSAAGGASRGIAGVVDVRDGDADGSRGGSSGGGVRSGSASGSPTADRAAAPSGGGGGGGPGGGGWRFSVPALSRPPQRRPPMLAEQMRNNPVLLLFLPVLLPLMIFEVIAVAIGEVLHVMVIAALCALAFLAPAVLYGLYRAVRWLVWLLLYAALRPSARGAAGGVTEAGSGGHRLTAAAGDGVNVGVRVAGGGGDLLGVGCEPLCNEPLQLGLLATPVAVAAPPVTDSAAGAPLAGAGLVAGAAGEGGAGTAAAAEAAIAECRADPADLSALLEGFSARSDCAGGDQLQSVVSYSGPAAAATTAAAAVESAQPLLPGGLDGLQEDCHTLQNQLTLQQGSCVAAASGVATAAAAAAATAASDDLAPGASTAGRGLSSPAAAAAATAADIPTTSAPSLLWYLLGLLWQAYLSFVLAIAASAIAIAAVRMSYEAAEAAARRVLPSTGSKLGALLHARAQRARLRGGGGGGEFDVAGGLIVVIAVILRWLGGTSFWALLRLLAAIWALVEAVWLVEEYRQQQRVGASRRDGSPPAGPPRRAAPSGDGVAQPPTQQPAPQVLPSGGGGAAAAAAARDGAGGADSSGGLDGMCCVCMSSRAVMGFVHANVVHCCMCEECEAELRGRGSTARCLICKRRALAVAKVIAT